MAAKAQLRADKPVLIALASNDALSANLKNVAMMRQKKNVFFSSSVMDDPVGKPHSLVAEFSDIKEHIPRILALYGK
jgi:dipicolinate synthase subunit B